MRSSRFSHVIVSVAGAALVTLLAGCSGDRSDLQEWMKSVRAEAKPVRQRVNEPRVFEPYRYEDEGRDDPFSPARIASTDVDAKGRGSGLTPDPDRPREPLEAWPLDSIRMVGYLANPQGSYVLLQADRLVYQAGVGNYVGRNHGVITRVGEAGIQLRELVQDATGDWAERETTLQIDEGSIR